MKPVLPNTNVTGVNEWSDVESDLNALIEVLENLQDDNVAAGAAIAQSKVAGLVALRELVEGHLTDANISPGSLTDASIADAAAIQQKKIEGLVALQVLADALQALVEGNLTDDNIAADAAIQLSKLEGGPELAEMLAAAIADLGANVATLDEPGGHLLEAQVPLSVVTDSDLAAQPTLASRINIVSKGAATTKTAAENAAAIVAAFAGLPNTGGRIEIGPGWWFVEEAVLGGSIGNVGIVGMGDAGSGVSGTISGKKLGATNLVLPPAGGGKSILVLGEATGTTQFFGDTVRQICFVDNTPAGLEGKAGIMILKSGYHKIVECSFQNFKNGTGIGQETSATEYVRIRDCNFLNCKYGIKITLPDLVVTGCMIKGCKNTEPGPIAGSVGLEIGGLSRVTDTVVQGHDIDIIVTGSSNLISVRTETVATFTTEAHRAMVVNGNDNIINLVSINNNHYSEKALQVVGSYNTITTNLPAKQIEDLGVGNRFFTIDDAENEVSVGENQITPNAQGAVAIVKTTGGTEIKKIAATRKGYLLLRFLSAKKVVKGENLKIKENFEATELDTMLLWGDGTNYYEISRSAN